MPDKNENKTKPCETCKSDSGESIEEVVKKEINPEKKN